MSVDAAAPRLKASMKYPPVTLANRSFTKKQLEEWVAFVLSTKSNLDQECNQMIAREAVCAYDKVYSVGEHVCRVFAGEHPDWGARGGLCFHVVFEHGGIVTVSRKNVVRACFDPDATAERRRLDKLYGNMREVVHRFVGRFKDDHSFEGKWKCELCATSVSNCDEAHVDHVREFRFLVEEFMTLHRDYAWSVQTHPPYQWEEWHNQNATLRILCRSCNLKRSKPKIERP